MARYRFEFRHAGAGQDVVWVDLPDVEAARREALASARELLIDAAIEGFDRRDWVTKVCDESGAAVVTIDFADLMAGKEDG